MGGVALLVVVALAAVGMGAVVALPLIHQWLKRHLTQRDEDRFIREVNERK